VSLTSLSFLGRVLNKDIVLCLTVLFFLLKGILVALVASTVFLRTQMHTRNEEDGQIYIGALLYVMIVNMFNGFAESSILLARLPVLYKHRDFLFYRPWTIVLPNVLMRVPASIFESIIWVAVTYYSIGFAPEASRCAIITTFSGKIVYTLRFYICSLKKSTTIHLSAGSLNI
jgi:hypothetical protein